MISCCKNFWWQRQSKLAVSIRQTGGGQLRSSPRGGAAVLVPEQVFPLSAPPTQHQRSRMFPSSSSSLPAGFGSNPGAGPVSFGTAPLNPPSNPAGGFSPSNADGFSEKEGDFETMVSELRGVFVSWLRRSEQSLRDAREDLAKERKAFEDEKSKVWAEFMQEKQAE